MPTETLKNNKIKYKRSKLFIADKVLSYKPKNNSIYEKLIPGRTREIARGKPIKIKYSGFSLGIKRLVCVVINEIKKDSKIPKMIASNFDALKSKLILLLANKNELNKEIDKYVNFDANGNSAPKIFSGLDTRMIENTAPATIGKSVKNELLNRVNRLATDSIINSKVLVKTATVPPLMPGTIAPAPIKIPFKNSMK